MHNIEKYPGPGTYYKEKFIEIHDKSTPAFMDTMVKEPNRGENMDKGAVAQFVKILVENERDKHSEKINNKIYNRAKEPAPSYSFKTKKPKPEIERKSEFDKVCLTTLPVKKLLGEDINGVGEIHSIHLHQLNDPKNRIILRGESQQIPFLSEKRRFDSDSKNVPGPAQYNLNAENNWEKKNFNIRYVN